MNTGSTVLDGISWQTYSQLRDELDASEQSHVHLTYDRGCLEIEMSPLPIHGRRNYLLEAIVSVIAEERELDLVAAGDATFRRPEVGRAGEPDSCFYFRNLDNLPREIDAAVHAPDLVIEVDITIPLVDKQRLYAAMRVTEIWHDNGQTVTILVLDSVTGQYTEASVSVIFPLLDTAALTRFVEEGLTQRSTAWRRGLRAWARENQINGNL
jgi:Uma2 family endonuclease